MPLINAYVTTTMVGMLLTSQFVYVFVGYAYQQAFSAWFSSTYTQIRHSDTHKNLTISALLSTLMETNNVFVSICLFIYFLMLLYHEYDKLCVFIFVHSVNKYTEKNSHWTSGKWMCQEKCKGSVEKDPHSAWIEIPTKIRKFCWCFKIIHWQWFQTLHLYCL